MTDSEKLDLILTKLQRIEDRLGITDQLQREAWHSAQRRIQFDLLSPEEQERQRRLARQVGQSYGRCFP